MTVHLHPAAQNELLSLSDREILKILYIHDQIEKNGFEGIKTEKIRQDRSLFKLKYSNKLRAIFKYHNGDIVILAIFKREKDYPRAIKSAISRKSRLGDH